MPLLSRTTLAAGLLLVTLRAPSARAQVRERPVAFDDAGRISVITPFLAARLGLSLPLWPVTGDYLDARLYAIDEAEGSFVLVVRRPQEVLERLPIDAARRRELAQAIARADVVARATPAADSAPTSISEPVRGSFVANQAILGLALFGPAAAAIPREPTTIAAAYLLVAGGTFFAAAGLTSNQSVSRAQNHLSWHSARRGAAAASLAVYALDGGDQDHRSDAAREQTYAAALLVGGVVGDVIGFQLARPMTDGEAHGTSHGSTIVATLAGGALGTMGLYDELSGRRVGAAAVIAAGALGYPLGLRHVRNARYRVTAGDVGTMVTTELLGMGAAATLIPDDASSTVAFGMMTVGFAAGAVAGDRLLVRPFDHAESEARLLAFGTGAGALMGLAIPALAQSSTPQLWFGTATIGGVLGAIATQQLLAPHRATLSARAGAKPRVGVRFAPEAVLMAGLGQTGKHSILSLSF